MLSGWDGVWKVDVGFLLDGAWCVIIFGMGGVFEALCPGFFEFQMEKKHSKPQNANASCVSVTGGGPRFPNKIPSAIHSESIRGSAIRALNGFRATY